MTVQELMTQIGKEPPALVYLFCPGKTTGKAKKTTFEPVMAERAIERMVQTYVDPATKDLVYAVFHADETDPRDVIAEAETLPFLAERRVLVVRNAEGYMGEDKAKPLIAYIAAPCDTTLLILVASHMDRRTKLFKVCQTNAVVIECPQLSERAVEAWARSEAEARGKHISLEAVRELVSRAGTHLGDVENAITVVASFVGDAKRIEEEDVVAACADVAEEEVWALTDAIAESNTTNALKALRKLRDLGKHEDELMGTINWLLRSAYVVATAVSRPPLDPYLVGKVAPLARKLGVVKLRDAFRLCTDTHFMIRSTGVDSTLALELLVVKLATPRQRSATPARS
ncbi:MAG TPA: DNA polymerase III subunit delta [Candidatus Hydrogenedentes bacterium]|nr:DNA polymerase III subunit delta [Candidatus Hydrogenedentota bacterium]